MFEMCARVMIVDERVTLDDGYLCRPKGGERNTDKFLGKTPNIYISIYSKTKTNAKVLVEEGKNKENRGRSREETSIKISIGETQEGEEGSNWFA